MIYFSVHTHVLHFLSSHSYDIIVMFISETDDVDLPVVFVGKVSMVKGSSCECFSHLLSHLLKHLHNACTSLPSEPICFRNSQE